MLIIFQRKKIKQVYKVSFHEPVWLINNTDYELTIISKGFQQVALCPNSSNVLVVMLLLKRVFCPNSARASLFPCHRLYYGFILIDTFNVYFVIMKVGTTVGRDNV